jgi:hypothetical protein
VKGMLAFSYLAFIAVKFLQADGTTRLIFLCYAFMVVFFDVGFFIIVDHILFYFVLSAGVNSFEMCGVALFRYQYKLRMQKV